MKVNNSFFKLIIASIFLAVAPIIAAAQTTEIGRSVYLMSGLANFTKGQAVSLDFTNVDRVPRDIKMFILDANGDTLKSVTWRVNSGQSVSLSFMFGDLGRINTQRMGVRGVVIVQPTEPDANPPQPDFSLANLEIYDVATGKTTYGLLLPAVRNINALFPTDQ